MPEFRHHTTSRQNIKMHAFLIQVALALVAMFCLLTLTACPQDQAAHQSETLRLKKQIAKLESVIQSLQEGNRVLQQQIDRLNQEARETAASYETQLQEAQSQISHLANTPKKDVATIQALEKKVAKLQGDAQWLRKSTGTHAEISCHSTNRRSNPRAPFFLFHGLCHHGRCLNKKWVYDSDHHENGPKSYLYYRSENISPTIFGTIRVSQSIPCHD